MKGGEIILDFQTMYDHPAPSAGRITRAIFGSGGLSKIPEHILENARKRGTWVHESIEKMILGEEYESNWEWEGYMEAFKSFLSDHNPKFAFTELPIVGRDERVKGVIDALVEIDGEMLLIDFKTSATSQHHLWKAQLMLYNWILKGYDEYPDIDGLRVVKLKKDGTYTFIYYDFNLDDTLGFINVYEYMLKEGVVKAK